MENSVFTRKSLGLFTRKASLALLVLLFGLPVAAQLNNPAAAADISFEQYAVDLSTGIPQIGVPVYSLPTRDREMNIDLLLNYHPSAVAAFNQEMGDCGHGWSLQKGGIIFRTLNGEPDEANWVADTIAANDLYEFRFLGYSGKFTVEKMSNNQLEVFMTENKGMPIEIEANYNPATYVINSFTLYDDRGHGYVFEVADTAVFRGPGYPDSEYKSAYHLSGIRDSNNIMLAQFYYNSYFRILPYHASGQKNTFHVMRKIESPGFGEIELTGLYVDQTLFNYTTQEQISIRYDSIVVKDVLENTYKTFSLNYEELNNRIHLVRLDETQGEVTHSHHFEYKTFLYEIESIVGVDRWGYYNLTDKWCNTSDISRLSSDFSTYGILQKIKLPAGGSIIYEFERNTYYYTANKALDSVLNPVTMESETDENFFYDLSPDKRANNLHNYTVVNYASKGYLSVSDVLSFTVNSTETFHFKFDAYPQEVIIPNLDPEGGDPITIYVYPVFTLKKEGVTVQEFSTPNNSHNFGYQNQLNNGLGKDLELTPGSYTLEMTMGDVTTGSARVNRVIPVSQPKKWWYGGGLRIQKIGYFTEETDRRYYQNHLSSPQPVKEVSYEYTFFNEPDKSSGYLKNIEYTPYEPDYSNYDLIRYKNITVRDSDGNGKTQYLYYSPIDNLPYSEYTVDQRVGRIMETKVYNHSGNLLHSTEYNYDMATPSRYLASNILIWNLPKTITEKEYLSGNVFQTATQYEYNTDLKIRKMFQYTSYTNDTLSTCFYYHKNNTVYSKNRNALERVENYRNSELLTSFVVNYSNTWPAIPEDNGGTNVSFLPLSKDNSKGDQLFYTEEKVNLYDHYGNIIEFENQTGVKTVNIWGYDKTLLVAKLEKASYSEVPQNLITAIQSASDTGNETALLTALENLRNDSALAGAMITTYTYKPLVGVTSETDYKGDTRTYEYDPFGRLIQVKDKEGNSLTENEYHYRTQN